MVSTLSAFFTFFSTCKCMHNTIDFSKFKKQESNYKDANNKIQSILVLQKETAGHQEAVGIFLPLIQ